MNKLVNTWNGKTIILRNIVTIFRGQTIKLFKCQEHFLCISASSSITSPSIKSWQSSTLSSASLVIWICSLLARVTMTMVRTSMRRKNPAQPRTKLIRILPALGFPEDTWNLFLVESFSWRPFNRKEWDFKCFSEKKTYIIIQSN